MWSKLFGGSDIVKSGMNLLDDAFYTDSEIAKDNIELTKIKVKHKIELLKGFEPFKISQRIFMLIILINFSIAFIIGLLIVSINLFINFSFLPTTDILKPNLLDLSPLLELSTTFGIFKLVGLIGFFYFGGGMIESFNNTKQRKS